DERALGQLFSAIERSGFLPAEEVGVAVDVAAHRLYRNGRYHCGDTAYDADGWAERLGRPAGAEPLSGSENPAPPPPPPPRPPRPARRWSTRGRASSATSSSRATRSASGRRPPTASLQASSCAPRRRAR